MPDQSTEMEKKMIEFATKTAHTIQTQAGQIQALSHALLISLVAIGEHNEPFKKDFVNRIEMISDHLSDKPVDQFSKEYFDEIVRFLSDPYHYSKTEDTDGKPGWFKGIITGGKPSNGEKDPPPEG